MKPLSYYMRALHRDLGYLIVGLVVVYSLSGVILIFRNTAFLKREKSIELQLRPQLNSESLNKELKMRDFKVEREESGVIYFKTGSYDSQTGLATYKIEEVIPPFDRFIKLHKITSQNFIHWILVLFGVVMFFMAISAFWMYKPNTTRFRRGIILSVAGVLLAVLLLFLL